jgi:hypothetical protein
VATWTQFTSYLDGSRSILKAERDEIYDNLATLLTASGCTDAGYSLDATELTAVKSSGQMTDRARLNGPAASVTRDRLQTLFATASAAFSNYSAAVTTALAGEGISSGQRDDYINGNVESWKLWNYYKRLIDALTCMETCPSISVQFRTRSASKTKCGHSEFGTPSSPPKIYLLKVASGVALETQRLDFDCGEACFFKEERSWSGHCEYTRPACGAPTGSMEFNRVTDSDGDCLVDTFDTPEAIDCAAEALPNSFGGAGETIVINPDRWEAYYDGICRDGQTFSGNGALQLSSEYTTALLQTDVSDALDAASWSAYGGTSFTAFWTVSGDEMTISRRLVQFLITFDTPVPGSGCKLTWNLRNSGGIVSSHCENFSSGENTWEGPVLEPAEGEELYFADFAIEPGVC